MTCVCAGQRAYTVGHIRTVADMGRSYVVSDHGIDKIEVYGARSDDLFPTKETTSNEGERMRFSICRIDEGYTVEDTRSGDRMSYHNSYGAALKSLTKLRRSIVLRDETVAEIWRGIPATCREPVDDDPKSLLILKQALDDINLSDEDRGYAMAGDWGFVAMIRSRSEYQRYLKAYEHLNAKLTAESAKRDDPWYEELLVTHTHSPLGIGVTAISALIFEWEDKWKDPRSSP